MTSNIIKSIVELNRANINKAYEAIAEVQKKTVEKGEQLLEKAPLIPEEGKHFVRQLTETGIRTRDYFKGAVDKGFEEVEHYLSVTN